MICSNGAERNGASCICFLHWRFGYHLHSYLRGDILFSTFTDRDDTIFYFDIILSVFIKRKFYTISLPYVWRILDSVIGDKDKRSFFSTLPFLIPGHDLWHMHACIKERSFYGVSLLSPLISSHLIGMERL